MPLGPPSTRPPHQTLSQGRWPLTASSPLLQTTEFPCKSRYKPRGVARGVLECGVGIFSRAFAYGMNGLRKPAALTGVSVRTADSRHRAD